MTKEKKDVAEVEEADVDDVVADEVVEEDADEEEAADDAEATDDTDEVDEADETTEDSDDEDDEDDDDDEPRLKGKGNKKERLKLRERPWGRYARRAALPVLLAISLAVSGFLGWKQWQEHQVNVAGEQARSAAIAYASILTSIDSNNVDENFRQVLDGATGEFKDMYTQSSVQLRQLLIDNKAGAHGVVVDSAIASATTDRVVVLLFIDQTVTNKSAPDPRIDRSRIKMTMEKVDGRWRAAKVQLL